jgi:glycosyltransferase involved in cell wall biosynthesis
LSGLPFSTGCDPMKRPIRVLQITRGAIDGGFDFYREISQAFAGDDFQVTTVFVRGSLSQEEIERYAGDVVLLDAKHRRRFRQRWFVALKLWLMSRRAPFDLAICHHHKPAVAVNTLNRLRPVGRMYFVVHDYDYFSPTGTHGPRRRNFVLNELDPRCTFVAVSQAMRDNILQSMPQLDPQRCTVIPNAIDDAQLAIDSLDRHAAREALGIDPDAFVFGTIGRLVAYKAHSELIDAFAQVHERMPDARLLIIGRGKLHDRVAAQIRDLGLKHKIRLIGFLPKAARYMTAFDVFAFPSHNEPFGLVLLEAMVNRLPILAADSGAVPEIVPNPAALFETGDTNALAARLLDIYRMPAAARLALGELGHQHLQRNFSLEHYRDCYRRLWGNPG